MRSWWCNERKKPKYNAVCEFVKNSQKKKFFPTRRFRIFSNAKSTNTRIAETACVSVRMCTSNTSCLKITSLRYRLGLIWEIWKKGNCTFWNRYNFLKNNTINRVISGSNFTLKGAQRMSKCRGSKMWVICWFKVVLNANKRENRNTLVVNNMFAIKKRLVKLIKYSQMNIRNWKRNVDLQHYYLLNQSRKLNSAF